MVGRASNPLPTRRTPRRSRRSPHGAASLAFPALPFAVRRRRASHTPRTPRGGDFPLGGSSLVPRRRACRRDTDRPSPDAGARASLRGPASGLFRRD